MESRESTSNLTDCQNKTQHHLKEDRKLQIIQNTIKRGYMCKKQNKTNSNKTHRKSDPKLRRKTDNRNRSWDIWKLEWTTKDF